MTKTPREQLTEIGYRIGDCANLAAGIDVAVAARGLVGSDRYQAIVSGMASVLEVELNRLSEQIDEWATDHGGEPGDAQQ